MVSAGETPGLVTDIENATGEEASSRIGNVATYDDAVLNPQGRTLSDATRLRPVVNLRKELILGTWNVRSLYQVGKLQVICEEMDQYGISILGLSEIRWRGKGCFRSDGGKMVIYSGGDPNSGHSHGVSIILTQNIQSMLLGYNLVNDRIITVRLEAKPHNITIIQFYAPTSIANDEEHDEFI